MVHIIYSKIAPDYYSVYEINQHVNLVSSVRFHISYILSLFFFEKLSYLWNLFLECISQLNFQFLVK